VFKFLRFIVITLILNISVLSFTLYTETGNSIIKPFIEGALTTSVGEKMEITKIDSRFNLLFLHAESMVSSKEIFIEGDYYFSYGLFNLTFVNEDQYIEEELFRY